MHKAYELLGVSSNADETEIRNRYLRLVREFPPDRAPEKFAEIRAAYDELRNPIAQLERRLFSLVSHDSLESLQTELRMRLKSAKISTAVLFSLADVP